MASLTSVAIAVICSIKAIDTIVDIVARMRVDYINNDEETKTVGFVHQVFEVIRSALAWACGKVTSHMIPEWAIVWVFLYGH